MAKKRPVRASEPAPKIPEANATDLPVHVHVPTQTGLGITMLMLGIDAPPAWERDAIAELSRHEYYRNEFGAMGIPLPSTRTEWAALIGRIGDPALLLAFERGEVNPAQLLVQFANRPKTEPAGQPFILPAFPHVAAPSTATPVKTEAAKPVAAADTEPRPAKPETYEINPGEWTGWIKTKVAKSWFPDIQSPQGWTDFANARRDEGTMFSHPISKHRKVIIHRCVFSMCGVPFPQSSQ